MGEAKGLIHAHGKPWLECQLDRFRDVGGKRVMIVLGYEKERYLEAISWLKRADGRWFEKDGLARLMVINEAPEHGPFSSITAAARALREEGAFVLPVDVPVPEKDVWEGLAKGLCGPIQVCVPVFNDKGGHPVLLASAFLEMLTKLPVDSAESRLDLKIRKLGENQKARISVNDERILRNMNQVSDLEGIT